MVSLKDVHHICIGYDQHIDIMINRDILRANFSEGFDLWFTVVYNGDDNLIPAGCGENTFIRLKENSGYAYGALDAINKGLDFALDGYRDIVVLSNFDGYFFSEEKYKILIEEFIDSGKPFGSGFNESHKMPLSDLMLFKREFLSDLLPITPEFYPERENMEFLQKLYEGTELRFHSVEEWVLNALYKIGEPDDLWHKITRDGHPRYRFTEKYAFGHLHDIEAKIGYMKQYNIDKGGVISAIMEQTMEQNNV